ncbi:rhodanese-like domain-containing protein [Saccharomonospora piscinae]|uniref:Sulfurtransferase n=1 Tax=Saccharomonospora piscinae TaxID=687388 RepID=A0A1V9A1I5_SACPI|nr:rhodanese-like domain-containing protein [Saccharomonospora piscinae]OQO91012.1 sulfurtransferase [Saccharomonospora piscinae]TLW93708.1 rhodanese-like domain-containing protein [Saccharomonospora piscinae]
MTQIDTTRLRTLLTGKTSLRLIDVRSPGEFAAEHIPGSANVPLDVLRARQDELTVRHDDPIVLVCASGGRAEQARTLLHQAGAEPTVLAGGLGQWERDGGDVRRGRGAWAMERQVRLAAGTLVLSGVLGSIAYRPLKWLAGFVGAGLTVAAVTNTCAMSRVLALLPVNRRAAGAPDAHVAEVTEPRSPLSR